MAQQITDANYNELLATDKLVVIDFWAEWCDPCRKLSPVIEELANEYEGKVLIVKCDAEENMELTSKFGIRNLPTLLFIRNNEAVDRLVGAVPTNMITEKIDSYQ